MIVMDEILDADQVAQILKVAPITVKRLARRGELAGFKVAGQWRFRAEAISAHIKAQEAKQEHRQEDK